MDERYAEGRPYSWRQSFRSWVADLTPSRGREEAQAQVQSLLSQLLGLSAAERILRGDEMPTQAQRMQIEQALARLLQHEPLQYITGEVLFDGLLLAIGPGALIPRPETEALVHHAYTRLPSLGDSSSLHILDACTGSGCIALALKSRVPLAEVTGLDISADALAWARRNGGSLGLRVRWQQVDLFGLGAHAFAALDLLIANPPYVPAAEAPTMAPHVREHEPHLALFVPDEDPLRFHRHLLRSGRHWLRPGAWLALELHPPLAHPLVPLAWEMGYGLVDLLDDFQDMPRFLLAQQPALGDPALAQG